MRDGVPGMRQVEEHRVRLVLQPETVGANVSTGGSHAVRKAVGLKLLSGRRSGLLSFSLGYAK